MSEPPEDWQSASALGLTKKEWWSDKLKEVLESILQFGVSRLSRSSRGFSACERWIDTLQRGLADAKVGIADISKMVSLGAQRGDVLSSKLAVRGHTLSQLDGTVEGQEGQLNEL
ncbi:hypothetical protein BV898_08636 [Hypsibius exemplaris]|uniref:Uncharacterized protein n=1 Tax=Hypsibius exemplaris TaxID=2072580 RepID=A0A1W0WPX5_HYPEX|nr:hypothetical protein BV898_08636 [Hypsibius exemplaris]